MRAPFLAAAGLVLLIVAVAGCGDAGTASPPSPTQPAAPSESRTGIATPTEKATLTPTPMPTPEAFRLGDVRERPTDGMRTAYVPAGEFSMGSADRDRGERPVHQVVLDGFWLDQTEVTNAQYELCVSTGQCRQAAYADRSWYNGEDQPVVGVTWYDAATYCAWVGGGLPTEAQWEYAARGSAGNTYPWGEDPPDCDKANFWVKDTSCAGGTTAVVGSYPDGQSWCGAMDMAGNVWEWVADWYGQYPPGDQKNPAGPPHGDEGRKLIRGGSWLDDDILLYSSLRMRFMPTDFSDTVGFRCAVTPAELP